MVQELLTSGLILPNTGPFSSPILLVCKADDRWRLWANYRVVNEVTIKDKYPISVIKELLDGLYNARYFSKLDLNGIAPNPGERPWHP